MAIKASFRAHSKLPLRSSRRMVSVRASTKVPAKELFAVAKKAAACGAEVVSDALSKPRSISKKTAGHDDIVTLTDKAAEKVIIAAILEAFPDHGVLGEEGGITGNTASDYLWLIDPIDGTVNFAHGIDGFCVSVGVLRHATAVAGCVIEFTGGPNDWVTREFAAYRNGGATCNGKPISVSGTRKLQDAVIVTEVVWEPEMWGEISKMYQEFAKETRGVRMHGAAAANLCHLAYGCIDAFWQFGLKPWDSAAGVLIAEEAGARISTADGTAYSVFDQSLLATNDALYEQMLAKTAPHMEAMQEDGISFKQWESPQSYKVRSGAQLDN